jgi:hypothetical protein
MIEGTKLAETRWRSANTFRGVRPQRIAAALAVTALLSGCNPSANAPSETSTNSGASVRGDSSERWNPFADKGLARIAVDLLINGLSRSQSIDSYLSDALLAKVRALPEAEARNYLRNMIFRDGMEPNLSSIKTTLDLNRGEPSYIESVAYYDRDIRPGLNHENVRITMLFEDGAWHVDGWTRWS